MKSLLIQLDAPTYRALNQIAAKRGRAQFIRDAISKAIRQVEYAKIRAAYKAQPDSESEADDWSTAEEYTG